MPANPTDQDVTAGSVPARVSVDLRRLPWMRRLAADYAHHFDTLAPFYAGNPADPTAWAHLIQQTQRFPRSLAEVASVVRAQQARRAAPPAAIAAADRLGHNETVAVVTGQQAGLFGGPLFTLLKALTALRLADLVTRAHGVSCVAVFWIDAEDHDWDEVRSCTVLDEALTPQTVALPAREAGLTSPIASVRLDQDVHDAIESLERMLPATEYRSGLIADLRAAYEPGIGMAEAFGRWLERLLGERGLVVFDASDPAAKPLAATVFRREVSTPGETARRANRAGADLAARGFHAQVQAASDALALFSLDDGRRPIRVRADGLRVGDRDVSVPDLAREVTERPSAFSPNVLLRPVVQDVLFPTVCYVAGPNELAYLGQLREVYEHFGVPMPLMYPRASATLLDASAMRFLTKYDIELETLQPRDDSALNALLRASIPDSVQSAFTAVSAAVASTMAAVIGQIPSIDPTLETTARSTLSRMQHDLETLQTKMIQAAKRRDETLRRQFGRTKAMAFPQGHAQERALGLVWFVNQYGRALVDRLAQSLPLELGHHWVLTI